MAQRLRRKLCVFGCYEDSELYSRNRALIDAMADSFTEIDEIRPASRSGRRGNHGRLSSIWRLPRTVYEVIRDSWSLARERHRLLDADLIFVPYPAYLDNFLLRLLTPRRHRCPVVVDAFLCLHDTLVNDRRMVSGSGILSRIISAIERKTLAGADRVFIDTNQQKNLLVHRYNLEQERVVVTPVGIDESVWRRLPARALEGEFSVFFWGTFIPLHGVDTIVEAAAKLQETHPKIRFTIVGDGQTAPAVEAQIEHLSVANITWERRLAPATELLARLKLSHCALGVFGSSEKAGNVIPYKVHQIMACNKVLISRQGPAMAQYFETDPGSGVFLVPPANAAALADSIAQVYEAYEDIRKTICTGELYDRHMSNAVLKQRVSMMLESL